MKRTRLKRLQEGMRLLAAGHLDPARIGNLVIRSDQLERLRQIRERLMREAATFDGDCAQHESSRIEPALPVLRPPVPVKVPVSLTPHNQALIDLGCTRLAAGLWINGRGAIIRRDDVGQWWATVNQAANRFGPFETAHAAALSLVESDG